MHKMCKFTNRLFVFVLLTVSSIDGSLLPEARSDANNLLLDLLANDNDYDLHYDQRQKGTENYRLKLDGFFIGLPSDETSDILLLTDDIVENLGEELFVGATSKSRADVMTKSSNNALKYDKAKDTDSYLAASKPDETVVKILPQKYEPASRQERLDAQIVADKTSTPRTKYLFHLLNMLKRSRKG